MVPVFLSVFVILVHNSIFNGLPSRQDMTFDLVLLGRLNSFHESLCSGNLLLKSCENGVLEFVKAGSSKDLDRVSAMTFSIPSIYVICRGDDLLICCLSARALNRCPAMVEVVVHFFVVH